MLPKLSKGVRVLPEGMTCCLHVLIKILVCAPVIYVCWLFCLSNCQTEFNGRILVEFDVLYCLFILLLITLFPLALYPSLSFLLWCRRWRSFLSLFHHAVVIRYICYKYFHVCVCGRWVEAPQRVWCREIKTIKIQKQSSLATARKNAKTAVHQSAGHELYARPFLSDCIVIAKGLGVSAFVFESGGEYFLFRHSAANIAGSANVEEYEPPY